jgi:hypothetical protein
MCGRNCNFCGRLSISCWSLWPWITPGK